jgi:hypothetical protein
VIIMALAETAQGTHPRKLREAVTHVVTNFRGRTERTAGKVADHMNPLRKLDHMVMDALTRNLETFDGEFPPSGTVPLEEAQKTRGGEVFRSIRSRVHRPDLSIRRGVANLSAMMDDMLDTSADPKPANPAGRRNRAA